MALKLMDIPAEGFTEPYRGWDCFPAAASFNMGTWNSHPLPPYGFFC